MASPQLELLRCATEPPEQALHQWQNLLTQVSVEEFDYPAQRLLPAVWVNLKKANKEFPEEARLRGVHRRTWIHNKRLIAAAEGVLELFAQSELPVMVLKGLAYSQLIYADSGLRPSWDFDLLVPWQRAAEALSLLERHGWRIKTDRHDPSERMEHGASLIRDGLELDLHWNLLREARNPEQDEVFWDEAVPFRLGGRQALTLSPTHQLVYLLAVANREPQDRVRYLLDVISLTRVTSQEIDYPRVPQMLAERHILARLHALPLEELGLGQLQRGPSPTLFDRLWSRASACVFDGSHEGYYLLFPLLDYWLHYRGRPIPSWSFTEYMRRRLKILSGPDFLLRSVRKLVRMVRYQAL